MERQTGIRGYLMMNTIDFSGLLLYKTYHIARRDRCVLKSLFYRERSRSLPVRIFNMSSSKNCLMNYIIHNRSFFDIFAYLIPTKLARSISSTQRLSSLGFIHNASSTTDKTLSNYLIIDDLGMIRY